MGQAAHSAGQVIFEYHLPRDKFWLKYLSDPGTITVCVSAYTGHKMNSNPYPLVCTNYTILKNNNKKIKKNCPPNYQNLKIKSFNETTHGYCAQIELCNSDQN